jgi:hypothetical protein
MPNTLVTLSAGSNACLRTAKLKMLRKITRRLRHCEEKIDRHLKKKSMKPKGKTQNEKKRLKNSKKGMRKKSKSVMRTNSLLRQSNSTLMIKMIPKITMPPNQ